MPKKRTRRRVDRSIYADEIGYEVVARVGRKQYASKRFPKGTGLGVLRGWRDSKVLELREQRGPTTDPRSLTAAIEKYFEKVPTTRPAERAALAAWKAKHGDVERRKLTPALCEQAFEAWRLDGKSPQTLYYRRLMLQKLWRTLDGPKQPTPVDDIRIRRIKSRRPVWVSDDQILAVLTRLEHAETEDGQTRLRSAKTRARFLVLATTGQRPAQLKRAQPADVQLWGDPAEFGAVSEDGIVGVWWVHPAKGGERVPVYLNREMRGAWELFIAEHAWGEFNTRSFARTLRQNGWPSGVRPYNLRHAVGLTLSERGIDIGDIQTHFTHTSMATTRGFYVPQLHARLRTLSRTLEGRFRPQPTPKGVGEGRGRESKS